MITLTGNRRRCLCAFAAVCLAIARAAAQNSSAPEQQKPSVDIPGVTTAPRSTTLNSATQNSAAAGSSSVSAPNGYQLSSNDSIGVEVFGEDDLKTAARLNAEGNVSLPLLGSIHLGGLTITQAAARVTDLYSRDFLVNPRVNVTLLGYAKRRFTVIGQVNRPGSYEMPEASPGGIDLLEAVAMAGGYTRIAAPERVTVRRRGESGRDEVLRVNAKKLERGDAAAGSFRVRAGDTITVGESIF